MAIDFNLLQSPNAAITQGMNMGAALGQTKLQADARESAARAAEAMNQDISGIVSKRSPTAADYAGLVTKYPQFSEQFGKAWGMLNEEQKANRTQQASDVYAALQADAPETALEVLETQKSAASNSGDERGARSAQVMIDLIKQNPELAKSSVGMRLASMMGPDKFAETFTKLEQERREKSLDPSKLSEAQAKARKAATEADFTEAQIVGDLQKQGWDIYKIQEDAKVAKENSKIAALNAQIKREGNDIKREQMELKLQEMKDKRDATIRERTGQAEAAAMGIDNALSTVDRLLQNPELDNILGSVEGSRFYPSVIMGLLNPAADSDRRADALADVETVQGQQFISNLMDAKARGATFGSLTEQEGQKLEGYISSLKTRQSEQQFRSNLRNIQRLLLKSRKNTYEKSGIPETIPDTPNAQPTPQDIEDIMNRYGPES